MSPRLQAKLLRVLETRTVRARSAAAKDDPGRRPHRRGDQQGSPEAIADGEFREDLYYRLAVIADRLPPLRERAAGRAAARDALPRELGSQNGKHIARLRPRRRSDWIVRYHWPGNVRELKNAVERSVIMARGDKITLTDVMPRHLRQSGRGSTSVTIPVGATVSDARRQLVLKSFASTGGDLARTAKMLGVDVEDVRVDLMAMMTADDGRRTNATGSRQSRCRPVYGRRFSVEEEPPAKSVDPREDMSMSRYQFDDGEPYVVVERHET